MGRDIAGFVVTFAHASEMARIYPDCRSDSDAATNTYFGDQSLGITGGEGEWISGTTQAAFTDFPRTLELNPNRSGGFTLNAAVGVNTPCLKMITNIPTASVVLPAGSVVDPKSHQKNGY